jgi:hypothetical protein
MRYSPHHFQNSLIDGKCRSIQAKSVNEPVMALNSEVYAYA